jgi:hypothetical protein
MTHFGQIITEIWDEFQKDPDHRYYVETSKETMKLIIQDLAQHCYTPQVIFQGKTIDLEVNRSEYKLLLMSFATNFWIRPSMLYTEETKTYAIHLGVRSSVTFMRKDDIPKGKAIIRKTKRDDPFID